jgi:predicted O-methyltransferase YrrM
LREQAPEPRPHGPERGELKHYFDDIPGWFNFQEAYDLIIGNAPADRPSTVVEVGAWKGRSTAYLGVEVINSQKPITVYAVDTFEGSDEEAHHTDPDINHLREVFEANLSPVSDILGDRFRVLAMPSVEAASLFPLASVDAVWLDGSHAEEDVAADIQAWWPRLRPGGAMGGDDLAWPGVCSAVAQHFPEVLVGNPQQPWWLVYKG